LNYITPALQEQIERYQDQLPCEEVAHDTQIIKTNFHLKLFSL